MNWPKLDNSPKKGDPMEQKFNILGETETVATAEIYRKVGG